MKNLKVLIMMMAMTGLLLLAACEDSEKKDANSVDMNQEEMTDSEDIETNMSNEDMMEKDDDMGNEDMMEKEDDM